MLSYCSEMISYCSDMLSYCSHTDQQPEVTILPLINCTLWYIQSQSQSTAQGLVSKWYAHSHRPSKDCPQTLHILLTHCSATATLLQEPQNSLKIVQRRKICAPLSKDTQGLFKNWSILSLNSLLSMERAFYKLLDFYIL